MTSLAKSSGVFCDFLDVTFSPTDFPYREVVGFLNSMNSSCRYSDSSSESWEVGDGLLKIDQRTRFSRVSASGSVLYYLRCHSLFHNYLCLLSDSPHRVTRVDAALNLPVDAAPILRRLIRKFPSECRLSRKSQRTKTVLSARHNDGVRTGSFYVGHRGRGEVSAVVYDKSHEAFEKRGQDLPLSTQFEVRVGKGFSPTLRDAAEPESMFWHFASPSLLKRPTGIPDWDPVPLEGWSMPKMLVEPAVVLQRRVETLPDLPKLLELADEIGPNGRDYLLNLLAKRINIYSVGGKKGSSGLDS